MEQRLLPGLAEQIKTEMHTPYEAKSRTGGKIFDDPEIPRTTKIAILDPVMEATLIMLYLSGRLTVQQLQTDKKLVEAANQLLREKSPNLVNADFSLDLMEGIHHKDIEAAINEAVVSVLIHEQSIKVSTLLHSGLLKAAITYLMEKHSNLKINRGFHNVLLKGEWSEEIEALLDEITQETNEEDVFHDTIDAPGDGLGTETASH
jgi:hypothetical protein